MSRKRKRRLWLDDLKRERAERLARYGFSARCIAQEVLGIVQTDTSYESRLARDALMSYLHSQGIRVTDYRNAATPTGRAKVREALAGHKRQAKRRA